MTTSTTLTTTRRALHAVAERLVAGPQYAAAGDIRLAVRPGGIGGWLPASSAIIGTELVAGEARYPLRGSLSELAAAAGITARDLRDVYSGSPDFATDEPVDIDPDAAASILRAFELGDAALRALAPTEERVLWPEHFDVGITVAKVNYGVSPGDALIEEPYAYVGPWVVPAGPFWNQPFGAARVMADLPTEQDVLDFFVAGRSALPGG